MEFLEFSIERLRTESMQLAKLVEASEYTPDCVVYLAKGGWLIGEAVAEYFNIPILELSAKRSGDAAKSSIAPILQKLPRSLKKFLREIEINKSKKSSGVQQRKNLRMTDRYPAPANPKHLLLVDDSADSGASIVAATSLLKTVYPEAEVKIGLINAFDEAYQVAQIDWVLHKNTMLSLPSSKDNKDYGRFLDLYAAAEPNPSLPEETV